MSDTGTGIHAGRAHRRAETRIACPVTPGPSSPPRAGSTPAWRSWRSRSPRPTCWPRPGRYSTATFGGSRPSRGRLPYAACRQGNHTHRSAAGGPCATWPNCAPTPPTPSRCRRCAVTRSARRLGRGASGPTPRWVRPGPGRMWAYTFANGRRRAVRPRPGPACAAGRRGWRPRPRSALVNDNLSRQG